MKASGRPRLAAFGWSSGPSAVTFLGPTSYVDIAVPTSNIEEVLREFSGRYTFQEIADKTGESPESVTAIAEALRQRGLLADAHEQFQIFHRISSNPQPFSHRLTTEEASALVRESMLNRTSPRSSKHIELNDVPAAFSRSPTCRYFDGRPLDKNSLSGLLRTMYGPSSAETYAVPSAGDLYPLVVEVAVLREHADLPTGIYTYYPASNTLGFRMRLPAREELIRAFDSYAIVDTAAVLLVISARVGLMSQKYSNRAYRYCLIEAGHVAQNTQLFCATAGLGVFEYGGFIDGFVSRALEIDESLSLFLALGVGWPREQSVEMSIPSFELNEDPDEIADELFSNGVVSRVGLEVGDLSAAFPYCLTTAEYGNPTDLDYPDRYVGGCGLTSAEAQVTALSEAAERFASGVIRVDLVSSALDISGSVLPPDILSPWTIAQLDRLGLDKFDDGVDWQWVRGERANDSSMCFVAIDNVFYPLNTKPFGRRPCSYANSSGVACHSFREQALIHAVLELIERDAIGVMWYGRKVGKRLSQRSLSRFASSRVDYWRSNGYSMHILDLTLDSVPVALVLIMSESETPAFAAGAAAAFTLQPAVEKAVREAERLLHKWAAMDARPLVDPQQVQSPLDHGRYYLDSHRLRELEWMISMDPEKQGAVESRRWELSELISKFDPIVIDLNTEAIGSLQCLRVVSSRLLPISFGWGAEFRSHTRLGKLGLAFAWGDNAPPHFFA